MSLSSDGDPLSWENLAVNLEGVGATTTYIAIRVSVVEDISPGSTPQFEGHFVDSVRLLLQAQTPSVP